MNELKTLDEFIKERKQLSIEQKLNMSLDEIVSHKELNDDEYYNIESKDLDDELDEYFEIGKLDKELEDYFIISKKIKENKVNNEIVEWDYWGVTKIKNDDSQNLLLLDSNKNKQNTKIIKKNEKNENEFKHLIKYYKTVFILYEKQIAEYKKENYNLKCNNKKLRSHNRKLSIENKKLLRENKKYTSKVKSNKNNRKNNFLKKNGKKIYYKIISNII